MTPPRVVVVIQARMTSTRLPGKVLADLAGRPLLEQQVRRIRGARETHAIWIATTTNAADDPVADLAGRLELGLVRGDEQDVLGRYLMAADQSEADILVRLTADCPLADAGVIDGVVRTLREHPEAAYASNLEPRTFPRGLDTEAMRVDALRASAIDADAETREHVTMGIRRSDAFPRVGFVDEQDHHELRWTVDEAPDLELVRAIYVGMGLGRGDEPVPYHDIVAWVRDHPHLARINAGITTQGA